VISPGVRELDEALELAKFYGLTDREREQRTASAYYWGKQYDHLEDWNADGVALRDKKPRVRVRLTKRAVDEVNSYLFGRNRKPSVDLELDDEGDGPDETEAALDEERAVLERHFADDEDGAGVRSKLSEVGRLGLLHGSVVLIFHKRETDGGGARWSTEVSSTSMCKPTFGRDDLATAAAYDIADDELVELDEYWFDLEADPITGDRTVWLHRRRFTPTTTHEYDPIDVETVTDPDDLDWTENDNTVEHGLGFVPAEWITNGPQITGDVDGTPLLSEAEFSLEDSVNYTLSQLDRGISYNQEPTTVFSGIDAGDEGDTIKRGANNTLTLPPSPLDGSVPTAELLELQGGGQTTAMEYIDLVRKVFFDMARVAKHDPQEAAQVQSGVALERMLRPTLAQVDELRTSYGKGLARFMAKLLAAAGYDRRKVAVSWPAPVEPTVDDLLKEVQAAVQLHESGILDKRKALERVAKYYGIDDIDAFLEEADLEAAAGGTVGIQPPSRNAPPAPNNDPATNTDPPENQ